MDMPEKDKIIQAIFDAVQSFNNRLSPEKKLETSVDTPLFDENSPFDSLELFHLMFAIENELKNQLHLEITLADEKMMSLGVRPMESIGTLAECICMVSKNRSNENTTGN